jgi:hypothetical protein
LSAIPRESGDSIQHEVWSAGDQAPVVLIFDVCQPEVSQEERSLVACLMVAVDSHGDAPPATWSG